MKVGYIFSGIYFRGFITCEIAQMRKKYTEADYTSRLFGKKPKNLKLEKKFYIPFSVKAFVLFWYEIVYIY